MDCVVVLEESGSKKIPLFVPFERQTVRKPVKSMGAAFMRQDSKSDPSFRILHSYPGTILGAMTGHSFTVSRFPRLLGRISAQLRGLRTLGVMLELCQACGQCGVTGAMEDTELLFQQ